MVQIRQSADYVVQVQQVHLHFASAWDSTKQITSKVPLPFPMSYLSSHLSSRLGRRPPFPDFRKRSDREDLVAPHLICESCDRGVPGKKTSDDAEPASCDFDGL